MTRVRYTQEFKDAILQFYKENPDANIDRAQERAKELGVDVFSKNAHAKFRKEAKRPVGGPTIPDKVWMDVNAERFSTNFDSGKGGTQVAVFKLVAKGRIAVVFPEE